MNKKLLDQITEQRRFPFQGSDTWKRYFVLVLPAYFLLMAVLYTLDALYRSNVFPSDDAPWLIVVFWSGSILFTVYFLHRIASERKFYTILKQAEAELVRAGLNKLGWKIESEGSTFFIAHTSISWTSWGEAVTIILMKNEILFNARPLAQPFTFNREKVLKKRLENVLDKLAVS